MISLKGLTPYQAFALIEKESGNQPPDNIKDIMRNIVGIDGKLGEVQFENEGEEIGILVRLDTDEKHEVAEKAVHDMEFMSSEFGQECQREYGPPPEYNGGVGDSCDCVSCNYRRAIHGLDLSADFNKGMTRTESENRTVESYAKIGKKVPDDKNTEAGRHAFDVIKDEVLSVINAAKSPVDPDAELKKQATDARAKLVSIGISKEELDVFDKTEALIFKKNITLVESIQALAGLEKLAVMAKRLGV